MRFYNFDGISSDVDIHNDRLNGQLVMFILQLHQANATCATKEVTADSNLLGACNAIRDKLHTYIQALGDYVSKINHIDQMLYIFNYTIQLENQKCGCPGHEQCYYPPTVPDNVETRTLTQLVEDTYSQVVLTITIIRKIKYLSIGITIN